MSRGRLAPLSRWVLALSLITPPFLGLPGGPAEAAPAAVGSFAETVLWDNTDPTDRYERFHVQGFAVLPAGTPLPASGGAQVLQQDVVLAFTEGRYTDCDCSEKDLLLRRSVDGGQTWSDTVALVPDDPATTNSYGGPSPVVDLQTGAVFLFYRGPSASMLFKRSDDAGVTWSDPVDLTHLYATNPNGWTSRSATPGHGIQLDSGRLLMPVGHRAPDPDPNYGDDVLISDDHGATWRRSAPIPFSVNYPIGESRVFQRTDGAVVITGRWGSGGTRYRITSTSTDGGATWSKPVFDGAVRQFVSVDAGLLRYTRGPVNRLLFSRPDASARENMTVSISYDEGASYRYSRVVNPGPSYYSDLGALSDGTILLIYGRDGTSRGFPARISVARFDLEWLTNGRDSLQAGPGFTQHEYELAASGARTDTGAAPQLVTDANARGGRVARYAPTADGAYLEVPFTVPSAGRYEVAVRHHRLSDRARLRTSIDGVDLPDGRVDPTAAAGEGYQLYPLGTVSLAAGTRWVRFTVVGAGRGGSRVVAPDQLILTTAGAGTDTPKAIADNSAPSSFEVVSGTWDQDATGVPGYYGQFYATHPAGTGTARGRFRPDVPATGAYEVAVWYPAAANRASNTPYVVNHADGQATFRIDQRAEGARWVVLGTFSFVAGDTATIDVTDDADGYVIADAVRLSRVGAVVDNDTASFDQVSGTWNNASGVSGYYGHNYRTSPAGDGAARARWRPEVPATGVYQVAVWYTADANRASNAPYVVNHAGGSTTVPVNQRVRGSQWVPLGNFSFVAGSAPTIELSNAADGYVIADAVRLTHQGIVADNDTPSFTAVSGTWSKATGVSGFYGHNYQTNPAGTGTSRARWQLDVPATGVYQVAVWYTAEPNRATNAPYVVTHAGGSTTVRVNQEIRGGQWVSLGEFLLVAGAATVELTNDADGYVIADAVRVLPAA